MTSLFSGNCAALPSLVTLLRRVWDIPLSSLIRCYKWMQSNDPSPSRCFAFASFLGKLLHVPCKTGLIRMQMSHMSLRKCPSWPITRFLLALLLLLFLLHLLLPLRWPSCAAADAAARLHGCTSRELSVEEIDSIQQHPFIHPSVDGSVSGSSVTNRHTAVRISLLFF